MRLEDPSEKGPHVPPLVLVIQQNGFNFVLIVDRFVVWRVLNIRIRILITVLNRLFDSYSCLARGRACESVAGIVMFYHLPSGLFGGNLDRHNSVNNY